MENPSSPSVLTEQQLPHEAKPLFEAPTERVYLPKELAEIVTTRSASDIDLPTGAMKRIFVMAGRDDAIGAASREFCKQYASCKDNELTAKAQEASTKTPYRPAYEKKPSKPLTLTVAK